MKLRILDNHVRLRLDRDEVDAVAAGNLVACQTQFPDGNAFGYRLQTGGDVMTARFADGAITIYVPATLARDWAQSPSQVAIKGALTSAHACADAQLHLLIEKDFECLDPRDGESQGNRFPNPAGTR